MRTTLYFEDLVLKTDDVILTLLIQSLLSLPTTHTIHFITKDSREEVGSEYKVGVDLTKNRNNNPIILDDEWAPTAVIARDHIYIHKKPYFRDAIIPLTDLTKVELYHTKGDNQA